MQDANRLLKHFLAAIAYRTQKALRNVPDDFGNFRAAPNVRTPRELVRHMDSVLGYAITFFVGGRYQPPDLPDFNDTVAHFHEALDALAHQIDSGTPLRDITPAQLLQGPLSDAMTHAGQLAMLRRLAGSPVPPENFVFADIDTDNLGPDQAPPARPDTEWPERP